MPGKKNPNKEKTQMVRLKTATIGRLRAYCQSLVEAVDEGRMKDPGTNGEHINPQTMELTFDQLINMLLDHKLKHRERAAKARAKKKGTTNE